MRKRLSIKFTEPSQTQQNLKKEADINNIVKRYEKTGNLSYVSALSPKFGDFSDIPDYQNLLDRVNQAEEAFSLLPSAVRRNFNNDTTEFVKFCSKDFTQDDLIAKGFLEVQQESTEETNAPLNNVSDVIPPDQTPKE